MFSGKYQHLSSLTPKKEGGESIDTRKLIPSLRDPTRATTDRESEGYRFEHGDENYITANQVIWRRYQSKRIWCVIGPWHKLVLIGSPPT